MSVQINIRGTIINFPSTSAAPNWSPAIIQFAQSVESSLQLAVGTYDVAPQTMAIANTGAQVIPNLSFDVTQVQSADITIAVYRTATIGLSGSPTVKSQVSRILITYNPTNSSSSKWEIAQMKNGDASITFSVSDSGQFSCTPVSFYTGGQDTHVGVITFSAKALQKG